VPELPEVESLVAFLRERAVGRVIARIDVPGIQVLKTYAPPVTSLAGLEITGALRHGKFLDIDVSGLHLVTHLSRAGWLHWRPQLPPAPPRMGKGPIGIRVHLDDGSGFDLTEAGTQKRLAVYVVKDPAEVPGVARLGVDPLSAEFTPERLGSIFEGVRAQVKGVLTDQSLIAGVGNAYSDEVLWEVGLSPFKPAANLTAEEVETLHGALVSTLRAAVKRSEGMAAGELKAEKKSQLNVHGRTGLPCPRCGDEVREVSFATKSLQYCATCQTDGKPLADRRMSRLLK
jgi:formamidopyrimidine-DNA glycosylase